MSKQIQIEFRINGQPFSVSAYPMARLLDIIREDAHLTGTKEGCGEGECGACSVILNGKLVNSCLVPALQSHGTEIQTIEGISQDSKGLHPLQTSFLKCGGAQCGICTPGMIMAACELLTRNSQPTENEIREGLAGNLCRCTGYTKIFDSVREASQTQTGVSS